MRSITILLGFLLSAMTLWGQMPDGTYGNEWIDYNKTYYKVKVLNDGLYRISMQALQNKGVNVGAIGEAEYQLFYRGRQVPIRVDMSSGGNYIEFYGRRNDGRLDKYMYADTMLHTNPMYSLVNDTSAYYLTWEVGSTGNARFEARSANLTNLPGKENYYMHEALEVYTTSDNKGRSYVIDNVRLSKSTFENGEGYGTNALHVHNLPVPVSALYAGPSASIDIRIASSYATAHSLSVQVGGATYISSSFNGDSVRTYRQAIPSSALQSPSTAVRVLGNLGASDDHAVSFLRLTYPRSFDFNGDAVYAFHVAASASRKYLEITNIDATSAFTNQIYLYDLTNKKRIQCFWDGSKVRVDLEPSTVKRELVLINLAAPNTVTTFTSVEEKRFTDFTTVQGDYVLVAHPSLRRDALGDPVQDYATFRSQTGFNSIVVNIDELYDQFAYGVGRHPLAVRHFAAFIKNNWTDVQYLFLIGKGRSYIDGRSLVDALIPTFGYPPSDNLLVATAQSDVPVLPIGRLAAVTPEEVRIYLNKMEALQSQYALSQTVAERAWMKNILHLGGGNNGSEQATIKAHLNARKLTAERPQFGGRVLSFFKTSSSPIQASQSEYLDSLINSGVTMITFFGHSSPNSFDFNLDRPEAYANKKRYPLIMALGCYSGTIYTQGRRISESFIFEPEAGASVFLASSGAATLSALNQVSHQFYTEMAGPSYGKGAGRYMLETIDNLESGLSYSTTVQMACHYMTYHGDPAYGMNTQAAPDYYLDQDLVQHEPSTVTTEMASFELVLDVHNLGRALDTAFFVDVNRRLPDGTQEFVTRQRVVAPLANEEVRITVPVKGPVALGVNTFDIFIDAADEVAEAPNPAAEQNNRVTSYAVQILSDAILPITPYEFAIVGQRPTLKASTGNSFAKMQRYVLQIDTTMRFNSPWVQSQQVSQAGGVLEWTPTIPLQDSVVYYWRVSPDSTNPSIGYSWVNSSFIYLNGAGAGWNQSHVYQYKRDEIKNMQLPIQSRTFNFLQSLQEITLNIGFTPTVVDPNNYAIFLNNSLIEHTYCQFNQGMYVRVFNPDNLELWENPPRGTRFGSKNCSGRAIKAFLFETATTTGQNAMANFIRDSIPNDHYVLVHALNDPHANLWSSNLVNALEDEGAWYISDLQAISGGAPYAFFFQKGDSTFQYKKSILMPSANDILNANFSVSGDWTEGQLISTKIGPAKNWTSLQWKTSAKGTSVGDELTVDVYGYDLNEQRQPLLQNISAPSTSLQAIDAKQYPYIQLVWNSKDVTNKTSGQLDYWRVLHDPVGELALRPDVYYRLMSDTVQQGQPVNVEVLVENIDKVDMDSVLIRYSVLDAQGITQFVRTRALPAEDTLIARASLPTAAVTGAQQILIEVNPNQDQPEMHHFNNIGLLDFYVEQDRKNPLMDVTFDGLHIMNGDIVSGKPEIVITLEDDNRFLGLNNLEDFRIILKNSSFGGPSGERELTAQNTDMEFYPAQESRLNSENKAQVVIRPDLVEDGTYTLFVSAQDRSKNNSGDLSYSVDFEVLNKPSISNVLNYPNPFTTSTQFVFTLTGRELPDYMKIQIMTITGKVVREIDMAELGPIHVGLNRTEFAWDGTDQFGDQLANGVYLYRVLAKINGQDYSYFSNGTGQFFDKGFGKMYLMR